MKGRCVSDLDDDDDDEGMYVTLEVHRDRVEEIGGGWKVLLGGEDLSEPINGFVSSV